MSQSELNRRPRIAVLGSINMDLVLRCGRLPRPGETVIAESFEEIPGGKGANQSVAAARAGGDVRMIGRIGDDGFGSKLLTHLREQSIDCGGVRTVEDCPTGVAMVAVEETGENSILVVPGANGRLTPNDVRTHADEIRDSDLLMVQLEVPIPTVEAAIVVARDAGVPVILDPAPAVRLPRALLDVDYICPNETEAATIVAGNGAEAEVAGETYGKVEQATDLAKRLHRMGPRTVFVTLGRSGTLVFDGAETRLVESIPVDAVDTTASGDAFAGTFAVRIASGEGLVDSIRAANIAGALAASFAGAQPSLPMKADVDRIASEANL